MRRMGSTGTMAVACTGFLALGLITPSLGPALPELARNAGTSLASVGGLFTAWFLGALLTQLLAGPLNDRYGQRPLVLSGLLLLAAGALGVTLSHSLTLMLLMGLVGGLGQGALVVGSSLLAANLFPDRSVTALNILNLFFGVAAVSGPALASLTLRTYHSALPPLWLSAALLLLQIPLIPMISTSSAPPTAIRSPGVAAERSVLGTALLWSLGALLLVYVGVETGFSGWSATYLQQTTGVIAATAALAPAGFWLAITVARIFGAVLGTKLSPTRLLLLCITGAVAGGILLVTSYGNAPLTAAAILLLGFSFGPIYPTGVALATIRFPGNGTATSAIVAMSSLGGMLIPAIQGFLITHSGPLAGAWLVLVGTALLVLLHSTMRLASRP